MISVDCVLFHVVEFLQPLQVHVVEPRPFEGGDKPDPEDIAKYESDMTIAYLKVANGVQEIARVNTTFFHLLWLVTHQAKVATMHDRALLRVVKARPATAHRYKIADMARLGREIGRPCIGGSGVADNNKFYWSHPKYNLQGISKTGDIPWSLALPPTHLGCRDVFQAYLTVEDKYVVSSLCDTWKVSICNQFDICSLFRGSPIGCQCKVGTVCRLCIELR